MPCFYNHNSLVSHAPRTYSKWMRVRHRSFGRYQGHRAPAYILYRMVKGVKSRDITNSTKSGPLVFRLERGRMSHSLAKYRTEVAMAMTEYPTPKQRIAVLGCMEFGETREMPLMTNVYVGGSGLAMVLCEYLVRFSGCLPTSLRRKVSDLW